MARRFSLFFFGVFLGSLFVYFTLIKGRDRNFLGWLPSPRVITKLQMTLDTTSASYSCYVNCHKWDNKSFNEAMEAGKVDFDQSSTEGNPKTYFIETHYQGLDYFMAFSLYGDTLSTLNSIHVLQLEKDCGCE